MFLARKSQALSGLRGRGFALAVVISAVLFGASAGTATARSCSVKVDWWGSSGQVKVDTCANFVEIEADCAFGEASSPEVRSVGAWTTVTGWNSFAWSCEKGNTFPYTYLNIHHYGGSWHQVATDGPWNLGIERVITSNFTEP